MDDQTPNLSLPYIMPSQAQKHVTHNEALRRLDVLTQMVAESRSLNEPPASPDNGSVYIVANAAQGLWQGHDQQIAAFQDGGFVFLEPQEGWRVFVKGQGLYIFQEGEWAPLQGGSASVDSVLMLGVNTQADETNRMAVRSDAVLFTHETSDVRTVLNKKDTTDTASFLFQNNFAARAEIGLTGDDDFHFKVSLDGATFHDGIVLDKSSGRANFPSGLNRNGIAQETLIATSAHMPILSGPTAVRFDGATNRFSWQGRFSLVSIGNGSHVSSDGRVDVYQPDTGVAVSGFGGASTDVVTSQGILLEPWEALYYVLPINAGAATVNDNFRRVYFTQSFQFPSDEIWILVALNNGDTGEINLGNGETIYPSNDFLSRHKDAQNAGAYPAFHAYNLDAFNGSEKLIFKDIQLNSGGHYDQTTGLFTAPLGGLYSFNCNMLTAHTNPNPSSFRVSFRRNAQSLPSGRSVFEQTAGSGERTSLVASTLIELDAGDTMEVFLAGEELWLGADINYFSGYMISKRG